MNYYPVGAGEEYELHAPDPSKGAWDEKTSAWRLQRFLEMGFAIDLAEELTAARVWTGYVEDRLLARGCSHTTAHAIAT